MIPEAEETFYNSCILKDILNVKSEVAANMLGKQIARDDCGNISHIGGKKVFRAENSTVFKLEEKYAPCPVFRVYYEDGTRRDHSMAAGTTLKQASEYYVGNLFEMSEEKLVRAVKVEALG